MLAGFIAALGANTAHAQTSPTLETVKRRGVLACGVNTGLAGFAGVVDLLKVAKHGPGEKGYLVEFQFIPPSLQGASADEPA